MGRWCDFMDSPTPWECVPPKSRRSLLTCSSNYRHPLTDAPFIFQDYPHMSFHWNPCCSGTQLAMEDMLNSDSLVTLAYAITDFKCQGQTFDWIWADIKKPPTGFSPCMSPYVQLSRVKCLDHLSIMCPFTKEELCSALPDELLKELEWEEEMVRKTMAVYETQC